MSKADMDIHPLNHVIKSLHEDIEKAKRDIDIYSGIAIGNIYMIAEEKHIATGYNAKDRIILVRIKTGYHMGMDEFKHHYIKGKVRLVGKIDI